MSILEYHDPDRFVVGTVGEPGQRTFFLQAHGGGRTCSVSIEKAQVSVLAERLDQLLDSLLRQSGGSLPIPAVVGAEHVDSNPLETPIDEEFRVVGLSLMWDEDTNRIVIECHSQEPEEDSDEGPASEPSSGETLRVVLTGMAARAFVARAESVVAAGRPPCPLCTLPLDPQGHICPRQNRYRRR